MDFTQQALKDLRPDTPNWYGWAKVDADGNEIPNDQRMCWEHAIVIQDGVTKPTEEEFNAKYNELANAYPMQQLRTERNRRLAETDWEIVMHKEKGTNIPAALKTYRQALRDITENYTSLDDVVWPEKP